MDRAAIGATLALTAGLLLLAPGPAAAHVAYFANCYPCHNLSGDVNLGFEPGTSYINKSSRTLDTMKILNGGVAPGVFGCTYCHNDPTSVAGMKDALSDFGTQTSMHFVGKQRSGAQAQTWNEYVSNWTGVDWGSNPIADELQCAYCHDPGATYPTHDPLVATNPNRLRGGFSTANPMPYNDMCVGTCHDGDYEAAGAPTALPNGESVPAMDHLGWGGYATTGTPVTSATLYEPRGAVLLQSACEVCHDTHSSNKPALFSDGTEDAEIIETDCTATCHTGADPASGYRTAGHGKPMNREGTVAIGFSYSNCSPCHTAGIRHHDPASPERFALTPDASLAGITYDGSSDGLDNNMNGQLDEAAEASYALSATSICRTCHSSYNVHSGDITGATVHQGSASCLDCHDPHGKSVGANIEMVRTSVAGEPTTYLLPPGDPTPDFYRADGTGACDNISCHAKPLGDDATPGTILGDVADHLGVGVGTNCLSCHIHSSTTGAPSFAPDCNTCHGYPPSAADVLADNTNAVGVHDRHVTQLGYGCTECHDRPINQHNTSSWTSYPGYPVPTANVDVAFSTHGGTVNLSASYDMGTNTCSDITCHNPDSSAAGVGITNKAGFVTSNTPVWLDAYTPLNNCTDCHVRSTDATPPEPDGGSHYKHDNPGERNYACTFCHSNYFSAGTHADLTLDTDAAVEPIVVIAGTLGGVALGGTYTDASGVCSAVYCHGTTLAAGGSNTTPTWGNAGSGACGTCHDTDLADTTPLTRITTGNHTTHVDPVAAPQGPNATCSEATSCHAPTSSALHVDGYRNFRDGNLLLGATPTAACDSCHNGSPGVAKAEWTQVPGHWLTVTGGYCEHCHDATPATVNTTAATGGADAVALDKATYFASTGHGSSAAYNATLHGQNGPGYACVTCHQPASAHIDATPSSTDRLRAVTEAPALAYTSPVSEFCLDCHQPGQVAAGDLGYDATAEASVHSGGVTGRYDSAAEAPAAHPAYGDAAGYAANPGYQCDACHDPHGTAKLAMVTATIDGNLGGSSNPIAVSGFQSADTDLADLDPGAGPNDGVCDVCHLAAGNTSAHPDTNHPDNHNQAGTGASCMNCHDHTVSFEGSCTKCHGDPANAAYGNQPTFWPDGVANNPARVAYADDAPGAHAAHIALLQAKEGFTLSAVDQIAMCGYCHPASDSGHTANNAPVNQVDVDAAGILRVDGTADQSGAADGHTAPSYVTATKTCATVDCHYERTTPGWESGATADCETCHYYRDGGPYPTQAWAAGMLPDAHQVHSSGTPAPSATASKSYPCSYCHDVTGYTTTHLNAAIDTSTAGNPTLNHDGNPADEAITPTSTAVKYGAGTADTQCTNLWCHGADFSAATQGTDVAPVWNDFTTGACGDCHDVNTEAPAFKDYLTQGAHEVHQAQASGILFGPGLGSHAGHCNICHGLKDPSPSGVCTMCHAPSGTVMPEAPADAGYATEPSRSHVEGNFEIDFEGQDRGWAGAGIGAGWTGAGTLAPLGTAFDNGTDICNLCHSTATVGGFVGATLAKQNWSNDGYRFPDCLVCHNTAAPAYSRAVSFAVDGSVPGASAPAKDPYWTSNGHGAAGVYNATGNTAPAYACAVCHAEDSQHVTQALGQDRFDPVVESPALAYTDAVSEVCLDCHAPGQAAAGDLGYDATAEASVHSGGVTTRYDSAAEAPAAFPRYGDSANYAANPGFQCSACHDVHGTDRLAMVRSQLTGGGGWPTTTLAGFQAADTDLADLDPSAAADDGVCDACHAAAANAHPDTNHANNHNQGSTGDSCMVCHDHTLSFEGSCTRCHGDPANAAYGNQPTFWPDATANNPSRVDYADNELGSHAEHIDLLIAKEGFTLSAADQIAMCEYCHPTPDAAHTADGGADQRVDVSAAAILRIDGTADQAGSADLNLAPTYSAAARTCSNVDCHYETTTPAYGGLGWDGGDTNTSTCTICHQGDAAYAAAGPGALPNAHVIHVDERADTGYDVPCTACHPDHGTTYTHLNGAIDFAFTTALGEPGTLQGGQAGSDAQVKYGVLAGTYATCSDLYCHGAEMPAGATGSDPTPVWNVTATGDCGTCHDTGDNDTTPSVISSGNHTDHLTAAYGPGFGSSNLDCIQCHPAYFSTPHVNGQKDFLNVDTTPNATSTLGATAPTLDPPADSTDRCTRCHSSATVNAAVGTVLAKTNWTNGAYVLPCLNCHNGADAATQNADGSGAVAPAKDAYYATTGHGSTGTYNATLHGQAGPGYTCSVCHDELGAHLNGAGGDNRLDAVTESPNLAYTDAVSEVCLDCHEPGKGVAGDLGYDATAEASVHSGGVTGAYNSAAAAPTAFPRYGDAAGYAANPGYQCSLCHDPHGTDRLAMIRNQISGGGGWPTTTISGVPATDTDLTGLDPTAAADDGVCDACHAAAASPHPDTAHAGNHNNTAPVGDSCMVCHNHTVSFQGSCTSCHGDPANAAYGNQPTAWPDGVANNSDRVAYADDNAGEHDQHIALLMAKEGFGVAIADQIAMCGYCHANPGAGGHEANNAPLNQVDVSAATLLRIDSTSDGSGTADGHNAASYDTVAKTCANADCHYETTTPGWEAGATATCTTCHGGDAAYTAGQLPNAHDRHVDETADGGYNYACTVCHPAGGYPTTHLNGGVAGDVSFAGVPWGNDADEATSGGDGLVKYGVGVAANFYTCNGISCHGDYLGGNNGAGGTTTNAPNWYNTVVAAPPGDGRCGSCHGTVAATDPMPAYPDTNPKANKHDKHHTTNAYGCQVCHYSVTTDGATVADRTLHANGATNVVQAAGATALHQFSYAAGTCSTTNCHGGNTVAWSLAGTIACDVCHGEVAGAPTNSDVNDFAWDGATQSKIGQADYVADGGGHGDSTGPNAPAKACSACHDSAVGHDTSGTLSGSNPFRLVDQDGATGGVQFGCATIVAGCHVGGILGPRTGLEISTFVTHSNEAMGSTGYTAIRTWPSWDPDCANCHDPHGDGNLSMIQREVYDKASFALPGGPPASAPTEQTALAFTDDTTGASAAGNSYADLDTPWSSICQECHEDASVVSFHDGPAGGTAAGANHPSTGANPGDCSACHKHDKAFQPSGCNGCHGTPSANFYPDEAVYPDRAGQHATHVARIAAVNALSTLDDSTCAWCHPNPGLPRAGTGETVHNDNVQPSDLHGDGRLGATVTHFSSIAGAADTGDSVTINTSCNNVDCHYNTTVTIADWYGAPAVTCNYCHYSSGAYAGQLPNAHTKHVDEVVDGGYGYACTNCHPNHGVNMAHQDGDLAGEVLFTVTAPPWGNDADESVTGGTGLPKYGGGVVGDYYTCNGLSCHGDFPGGNNGTGGTTTNAPVWYSTDAVAGAGNGDGHCGTCHGQPAPTRDPGPINTDGVPKANKHPKHATENGYGCQVCHYSVTTDGTTVADRTLHVNGALNVVQAAAATALHQFTYAAGSCSTVNCHGGNGVAWSAGAQTCDVCHGEVAGAPTNVDVNDFAWDGATQSKVGQSEYTADGGGHGDATGPNAPNKACSACHDSAVGHDTSGTLNGANPFRLVDQDGGTGGVQYACSFSGAGCHTAGTIGPATGTDISTFVTHSNEEMTSTGYTPIRTWPAWDPQCVNCHDPHGDGANLSMIQRELYDKAAFNVPAGPPPGAPTEQTALAFTDNATGATAAGTSFADLDAPFSSVCQECHEDASMVSFHDDLGGGTAAGANHPSPGGNPGDCSACHKHSTAFSPSACEGCHDGSVALAPNVIDGTAPWNGTLSYNWFGTVAGQDGGHGDAGGQPAVACTDCHDTGQPPGNLHLDGTYQSIWDNATRNANTAHLKAEFFARSAPPPVPVGSGTWDVQVYFDNYCAGQCHPGQGVASMWHERDTVATDTNHWSVELGTHFTVADGDALPYPVDADLNTGANILDVDYATCVSCHDPHGTTVVEPTRTSNRMVRDKWTNPPTLCNTCHL